ncbi:MAG: hypothetical protein ACFFD2_25325, partial [Promethearchaeota archaeon]
ILLEIQKDLEAFFTLVKINFEVQLTSIDDIPVERIKTHSKEISQLLQSITQKTEYIKSERIFADYMEFGDIVENILPILKSTFSLLSSNISKLYKESHRLLKYYWGIRFIMARYTLDHTPEYCENLILFFNMPDIVFEFIQELKPGPQPIELLAEIDLALRVDKRLPLICTRTPDHIALSHLGKRLLEVHSLSGFYYYYLYDFEEEVLDTTGIN